MQTAELIGIGSIVAVDTLAFLWLYLVGKSTSRPGHSGGPSLFTLVFVVACVCAAHFFGLGRMWDGINTENGTEGPAMTMIVLTILPGIPPAILFAHLVAERFSELSIHHVLQNRTARRPEQDFSRAQSMGVRGDIRGALAQYESYYREDPKDHRPLLHAYRLLYRINRREEGARYLRRIMKDFEHDRDVWGHAALELASHLQNDADNVDAARHVLREIVRKSGASRWGRNAQSRLQEMGPRTL